MDLNARHGPRMLQGGGRVTQHLGDVDPLLAWADVSNEGPRAGANDHRSTALSDSVPAPHKRSVRFRGLDAPESADHSIRAFAVAPEDLGARKAKRNTLAGCPLSSEDVNCILSERWSDMDRHHVDFMADDLIAHPDPRALHQPTFESRCSQRVALLSRVVRQSWPEGPDQAGDAPPGTEAAHNAIELAVAAVGGLNGAEVAANLAGFASYYAVDSERGSSC